MEKSAFILRRQRYKRIQEENMTSISVFFGDVSDLTRTAFQLNEIDYIYNTIATLRTQ